MEWQLQQKGSSEDVGLKVGQMAVCGLELRGAGIFVCSQGTKDRGHSASLPRLPVLLKERRVDC